MTFCLIDCGQAHLKKKIPVTPYIIIFRNIEEKRGTLAFAEIKKEVPFDVNRIYWINQLPEEQRRGGHAHRTDQQLIICTQGKVQVRLELVSGEVKNFMMEKSSEGLYIPPMWWGEMQFFDSAVLIGLSSELYNEEDYIRDKSSFK